jgi:glycosyltransferase 2 family protein
MKNSKPRFSKIHLSLILKSCVSIFLLYYLFSTQLPNLQQIKSSLISANLYLVLFAASLHIIGFYLCSLRWHLLLRAQNAAFSIPTLALSYLVGIFFNSFLPGTMSGDVVRAMDTSGKVGSFGSSILVVFVERLTGIIALLILGGLAFLLGGHEVLGYQNIKFFIVLLTLLIFFSLFFLFHPRGYYLIEKILKYIPFFSVRGKLEKIAGALRVFSGKEKVFGLCIIISILFQANVVFHYWVIGKALGIDIHWMLYFAIIPVSILILMIPASINGIGLREQVFIFLFGNIGVSTVLAVSLAWIAFGIALFQAVIGGVVFAIRKRNS